MYALPEERDRIEPVPHVDVTAVERVGLVVGLVFG
jgi:hypothetical protein